MTVSSVVENSCLISPALLALGEGLKSARSISRFPLAELDAEILAARNPFVPRGLYPLDVRDEPRLQKTS